MAAVVVSATAAAATPPSAAALPPPSTARRQSSPLLLTLPPLPGDARAGSEADEAGRPTRHVKGNATGRRAFRSSTAPWRHTGSVGSHFGVAGCLLSPSPNPNKTEHFLKNPLKLLSSVVS